MILRKIIVKKQFLFFGALAVIALPGDALAGDPVAELEMFSSSGVVFQAAAAAAPAEEKKAVGFSGELLTVVEDVVYSTSSANPLYSYLVGNLFLDARLKNGVKAFANMETSYRANTRETKYGLREAFIDFNIGRRAYFRAGKQLLQWGRCYLWNPTDLINVEKKPFIRKIGYREGAYGLKIHAPFGTKYNVYGFVDTGNAAQDLDAAAALKFEFLAGKTEMAFSGWGRRNRHPVFGYDVSSRLGDVDIAGEVSVARRDNTRFMREEGGALYTYRKDDDWPARAAVNLSKGFRLGEFNDRLTVTTEFFYNRTGYAGSPFRDAAVYAFSGPLAAPAPAGTKKEFLLGSGLYEPNYLSRYYGAAFISLTRFLVTDMTLNVNYIRSISDDSGALSAGATYRNLSDLSVGCLIIAFLGPPDREYTFSGARLDAQLTFGVAF